MKTPTATEAAFLRAGGELDQVTVGWHREHNAACLVQEPVRERRDGERVRAWTDPWIRCALDFYCPTCTADMGSKCRNSRGDDVAPHKRRRNLAQAAPWP